MTAADPAPPTPWLRARGVGKTYGGTPVLSDIDVDVAAGTVYGLVGENGAGKSTLSKIIAGATTADTGEIEVDGVPVHLRSPRDARALGIAIISQELSLIPARSVTENVVLGSGRGPLRVVNDRRDRSRVAALAADVGFDLDLDAPVATLSVAQRQQVEILRVLGWQPRLVVMDEPTAALSGPETERLLAVVRHLAAGGTSVWLVSHFLDQVLDVADQVIVLRDGDLIRTGPAANETSASLVRAMVGRAVDVAYPEPEPVPDDAPVVLSARGMCRGDRVHDVDVEVRAGEIVGLAGLIGAGRTETARLIFGADRADAGEIRIDGVQVQVRGPRSAVRHGIAMVPEDRKDQGLVLGRGVGENVSLANLVAVSVGGVVSRRVEQRRTAAAVAQTGVRGSDLDGPVWALSGGNQQKVLFAKWLGREPRILIVDEPTRGVDVGAKLAIHDLLRGLAAQGMAVLVISSEVEEVLGLSHRVLVMRHGRVVARHDRRSADPEHVLAAAFGTTDPETTP